MMSASAKDISVAEARISNIDAARTENNLFVTMDIDMTDVRLTSNQELIVTPVITNGTDSMCLQQLIFAGRNRYYNNLRNGNDNHPYLIRAGKDAKATYSVNVPYEAWMSKSEVKFDYSVHSCCGDQVAAPEPRDIAQFDMEPEIFTADFVYIPPKVEAEKYREESGEAFVDFIVNKTDIRPSYRNNSIELGKILNTIDKVRNDKDVTITGINIHGYASPEGPYNNNIRLAKGRTEALKQYVRKLYNFDENLISTDYTPEDWAGLRRYVENSTINNRQGILDIIDSDLEPDAKNSRIQSVYPSEYDFLLKNEYPALRHSDYVVTYKVRAYYDPEEIIEVMRTQPQKLSLAELYAAAQTLTPGSDDFNEVFEVAVRMFPNDANANLNAANAAMSTGNLKAAERYLEKAGDSEEAEYARGVLAARMGDFDTATTHFGKASSIPQAKDAIDTIERIKAGKDKVRIKLQ